MAKGSGCFNCRHHTNGRIEVPGWSYDCQLGIVNDHIMEREDCRLCPHFSPNIGFQIGGYYTHMWFTRDGDCLNWHIQGDGQNPIAEEDQSRQPLEFHLCEFEQLESFVKFWGEELRRRGWVGTDDEE